MHHIKRAASRASPRARREFQRAMWLFYDKHYARRTSLPVHLLVIPKTEQYRDVVELAAGDPSLLAEVVEVAQRMAQQYADGDFRLVFNTGANAGQTVFHVHAHVLAGGLDESSLGG